MNTISGMLASCTLAVPVVSAPQTAAFSEQTSQVGIDVTFVPTNYVHYEYMGGGTVGDFDGDGWQDLFAFGGGGNGLPDRLYMNDQDGTFTDRAVAWGVSVVHGGKGASTADFNGDGRLDIYVTSAGPGVGGIPCSHKLYRNNANDTFTDVAVSAGVNCTTTIIEDGFGSTWGDYDLDGDLDLFVSGFTNGAVGNKLFRNEGDETFTDVTAAIGLFTGAPSNQDGFGPRLVDMDGDFYPELLYVADFGTSLYFVNDGDGTFTESTASSGTGHEENGMGQCVGDFNGDGRLDWYVTSIYEPVANWTGNKLYLNQGNHQYVDVSFSAGVYDGGFGWGTVAVDFDHDTDLDIAETNGTQTLVEQSYLWLNNGDATFVEAAIASGLVHVGNGHGMVHFDADNDGDQDVVIFGNSYPLRFYRNELVHDATTSWLRVFLDSGGDPGVAPNGIGSRVIATVGGRPMLRVLSTGDNFLSHSEMSAHFGLGTATVVDELRVEWPDGDVTVQIDVPVNQTLTVSKGVPGSPFCFGVGCPCGNDSATSGCVNSTGSGAILAGTGSTSVAADDLMLTTTGCPPGNSGLYFMGAVTFAPVFVGDGLGCTGGLFRFAPGVVDGSGAFSLASPVAAAPAGVITPGDTRHFQSWTRDVLCGPPPSPCPTPCGMNSNLSSGYSVLFSP